MNLEQKLGFNMLALCKQEYSCWLLNIWLHLSDIKQISIGTYGGYGERPREREILTQARQGDVLLGNGESR